ncbi:hypothetical protein GUI12_01105 [Anaplasmataceae bacterium AB001_6]|nr:hypothetical protein GUI12_01105 [Anaplasmataceae bacterium AB001_6]
MSNSYNLSIVAHDNSLIIEDVVMTTIKTVTGECAVLANHEPFLMVMKSGIVKVNIDDDSDRYIVIDAENAVFGVNTNCDNKHYVICSSIAYDLDDLSVFFIKNKIKDKSLVDDLLSLKLSRIGK